MPMLTSVMPGSYSSPAQCTVLVSKLIHFIEGLDNLCSDKCVLGPADFATIHFIIAVMLAFNLLCAYYVFFFYFLSVRAQFRGSSCILLPLWLCHCTLLTPAHPQWIIQWMRYVRTYVQKHFVTHEDLCG